ncbi:cytidine deaminase [Bdellovibrio sp. HCB337]|uniref:cytidine deaminase n=1 Tax=Bdellovibrio sp. HCB337 TaxID=3394358 RepID=UPI0039A63256
MKAELLKQAFEGQKHAHAPYSQKYIGAAVLMDNGKIYNGCNVENASYGGTVCAERVAIFKAISEGAKKIKEVAVVSNEKNPWPPCGFCRQVIAEFASPETMVHLANPQGQSRSLKFTELFPEAFEPAHLQKP